MRLSDHERAYFKACSDELLEHHLVQSMSRYEQHGTTNRLDHSVQVAQYSYWVSKKLKLKLDQKSLIRGALLHDFFLYDWRVRQPGRKGLHAFRHPYIAYKRASNLFDLNKKEKDIIIKHMWPLTIIPPRYIESFIITLVDKYCALKESYNYYSGKVVSKKILRYASFLLLAFIVRIP